MSHRPHLRSALIGACTAALLAGSGLLALPVQAAGPQSSSQTAAEHRMTRPEMQVTTFFGDYKDAINGRHSEGHSPAKVREEFLVPKLDADLYQWGADNQKDPIFRRTDVPEGWAVEETGQADGHAKVVLTQTMEDGTTSKVWYQVNLDGLLIDGLTDPS
ncbi:hypothetical protein [Streptomyces sp. NPDC002044]|uniref:hypothetical protein n=1 Tax=Streptomyces sp. NPDC002044 TaxID=3154662 RepID=UPI00331B0451